MEKADRRAEAGFIDQVMRGEAVGRDVDDAVLAFAEVKALASGNPLIIELAGIQADNAKYERLEQAHREEQASLRRKADGARTGLVRAEKIADDYRSAIQRRIDTSGDKFAMRIEDQAFTSRADANATLRGVVSGGFQHLRDRTDRHRRLPERCIGEVGAFEVHIRSSYVCQVAVRVVRGTTGIGQFGRLLGGHHWSRNGCWGGGLGRSIQGQPGGCQPVRGPSRPPRRSQCRGRWR